MDLLDTNETYFGGPDLAANCLRDILLEKIQTSPPGSQIHWMCYYLNDPAILEALIAAVNRGVQFNVIIDANARIPTINSASIEFLQRLALAPINVISARKKFFWQYLGINWHPHFHSKLYYFSHPSPHVLVGSYNPTGSGNDVLPEVIREIGDHSISHNVLVNITNEPIVLLFQKYLDTMHSKWSRRFARYSALHNRVHNIGAWSIHFLPRLTSNPIRTLLNYDDKNAHIRCAISHLKGPGVMADLIAAAKKGKTIEILLTPTDRRVSSKHLSLLEKYNIKYLQPDLPSHCLMHSKFILYQSDTISRVMFGSFNWSTRSRFLNFEILVSTNEEPVVRAFNNRWITITKRLA